MTVTNVRHRAAGIGRLGTSAAWLSGLCCLPYLVLKVLWTLGVPVGITDPAVLESDAWVAANAVMAVIQLMGLALVVALTRPWALRAPAWLLLLPAWVGTGILFQVVVGVLAGVSSPTHQSGVSTGGYQPWVFVVVYAGFAGQGVALSVAFGCFVRARWGRLLDQRAGDVVARLRAAHEGSWLERHVTGIAQVLAGVALALAGIAWYWAAGGSVGLSTSQAAPTWAMQAARGAGAVTAVLGLLGLAGRWGHATRFWVPVALAWLGSGALAAFDGLTVVLNELYFAFGANDPATGWSIVDTILLIKVVLGLLAAATATVAVRAAKDSLSPATDATVPIRPT
jgi:hypothetical protein